MTVQSLPKEILKEVLSYMNDRTSFVNARAVCKEWCQILEDSPLVIKKCFDDLFASNFLNKKNYIWNLPTHLAPERIIKIQDFKSYDSLEEATKGYCVIKKVANCRFALVKKESSNPLDLGTYDTVLVKNATSEAFLNLQTNSAELLLLFDKNICFFADTTLNERTIIFIGDVKLGITKDVIISTSGKVHSMFLDRKNSSLILEIPDENDKQHYLSIYQLIPEYVLLIRDKAKGMVEKNQKEWIEMANSVSKSRSK